MPKSFLEKTLAREFAKGTKGKFLKGRLVRASGVTDVNKHGDPVPGAPAVFRVEGFDDKYSVYTQDNSGITDRDAKLTIIAGNSQTVPEREDYIEFRGIWWYANRVMPDPARATYEVTASPAKKPEGVD